MGIWWKKIRQHDRHSFSFLVVSFPMVSVGIGIPLTTTNPLPQSERRAATFHLHYDKISHLFLPFFFCEPIGILQKPVTGWLSVRQTLNDVDFYVLFVESWLELLVSLLNHNNYSHLLSYQTEFSELIQFFSVNFFFFIVWIQFFYPSQLFLFYLLPSSNCDVTRLRK